MDRKEFIDKINNLKNQIDNITTEYINSNKIYNLNDYLKVTFKKHNNDKTFFCKITNIYPGRNHTFLSRTDFPNGEICYYTVYCTKNKETGEIIYGDFCPLGYYNESLEICGHSGVDYDTLKIEVVDESEIK